MVIFYDHLTDIRSRIVQVKINVRMYDVSRLLVRPCIESSIFFYVVFKIRVAKIRKVRNKEMFSLISELKV